MNIAKHSRLLAAIIGLAAIVLSGCSTGNNAVDPAAGSQQRFVAGDGTVAEYSQADRVAAPRVQGELLDKSSFDMRELRGSVVVINFWGQWCAPCRAEADDLIAIYQSTKDKGVAFLGVNVRDSRDKARAFERSFNVPYPSIYDPAGRVALDFRKTPPNAIPATIVIDRAGKVAAIFRKPVVRADLEPVVTRIATEYNS